METSDYLIIGGGLAGLYCAYRLDQAGLPWRLLEAADSAGGRIAAAAAPAPHPSVLDLGPTWFWPHQRRVQSLLDELGIPGFPQYTNGDALFQTEVGRGPVRTAGAGAMLSYRVAGGMMTLVDSLLGTLANERMELATEVTGAHRDGSDWVLSARSGGTSRTFGTRNLIAALPPRQLLRGLTPAHWATAELRDALGRQQTWMAAQAKFVAAYAEPFWREDGLAGDAFSRTGPLVEIHDATEEKSGTAALFGFVGLPASHRATIDHDSLAAACLAQLEELFGNRAQEALYTELKDWSQEELIATAQDVSEAPAHASFPIGRFGAELESLGLHLAGSEYAQREPGYLEGALEASERALSELRIAARPGLDLPQSSEQA